MANPPNNSGDSSNEEDIALPEPVVMPRGVSRAKAIGFFVLKAAITVALLSWLFSRSEQLNAQNNPFLKPGDLDMPWLAAGVGVCGLYLVFWTFRWMIFLHLLDLKIGFHRAFQLTIVGHFLSMASFGGLAADGLKAVYLIRRFPDKKGKVAIAIFADHLSGLAAVGIAFALLTWTRFDDITGGDSPVSVWSLYVASGLWIVTMLGLVLTVGMAHPTIMSRYGSKLGFLQRNEALRNFVSAWDVFRRQWRSALLACGVGFPMLLSYYLVFFAAARAANVDVSAIDLLGAMPVIDTLTALPVTIAGLGLRETLMESLLGVMAGVSFEDSVRLSLTGFGILVIWGVLGATAFPFLRLKKKTDS